MSVPDLHNSTVVVLAVHQDKVQIYTDLDNMRLLMLFKSALGYLAKAQALQVGVEPEVGVVTIIFDSNLQTFLTTNMPIGKTRALVARCARDLLGENLPQAPKASAIPAIRTVAGKKRQ